MFEFAGKLLGIAVRTRSPLALPLAPLLWRMLVRQEPTWADVEAMDTNAGKLMRQLQQVSYLGLSSFLLFTLIPTP